MASKKEVKPVVVPEPEPAKELETVVETIDLEEAIAAGEVLNAVLGFEDTDEEFINVEEADLEKIVAAIKIAAAMIGVDPDTQKFSNKLADKDEKDLGEATWAFLEKHSMIDHVFATTPEPEKVAPAKPEKTAKALPVKTGKGKPAPKEKEVPEPKATETPKKKGNAEALKKAREAKNKDQVKDEFGFVVGGVCNLFAEELKKGPKKMSEIKTCEWNKTHATFYEAFKTICKHNKAAHKDETGVFHLTAAPAKAAPEKVAKPVKAAPVKKSK